jgi:lipid-A-disaccharide synthase-like uncharacterized protein
MNFETIPLIATFFSIVGRFIFIYLLHLNKSRNTYSLLFSISSIVSGSLWLLYSIQLENSLLIARTSIELCSSFYSSIFIINNKLKHS